MPVAIAERRVLRIAVLCLLYVAQGMPFGFVTVTLAAYLADKGASTDEVGGLVAWATLPWVFKCAWGPLIDWLSRSRMGRRRPWILTAQGMMVLTAAALIAIPELREDMSLLIALVVLHNVFASLQDVSVDALAVDLLSEKERGSAAGMMYGSSYLGLVIGGAGLSTVLGTYGLRAALLTQVVILTAIMLVPLLLREREGDAFFSLRARPGERAGGLASILELFINLLRAFARRSPLLSMALALSVQIAVGALAAIGTVLLTQQLGWTQEEYGQLIGGVPVLFGLAGSVAGGFVADRLGRRRSIALASILLGASFVGFAALQPYWESRTVIVAITCAQSLFQGLLSASLFALFIDVSWPKVAATQFTAYMALLNLSTSAGGWVAGTVQGWFGFAGAHVALGVFQAALVLLLIPLDPHQNRRELGEEAPAPAGGG